MIKFALETWKQPIGSPLAAQLIIIFLNSQNATDFKTCSFKSKGDRIQVCCQTPFFPIKFQDTNFCETKRRIIKVRHYMFSALFALFSFYIYNYVIYYLNVYPQLHFSCLNHH